MPARQSSRKSSRKRKWTVRLLLLLLLISVGVNLYGYFAYEQYFERRTTPRERFYSGQADADEKIAIVRVTGTIMPPITGRVLRTLRRVERDERVRGVLVVIDSPGGLVADSHQIYHRLQTIRAKGKPVYVAMKRIAASGGYYIAMGSGPDGKIFAEPTTWTGSIGVIIPRYDVSGLAEIWHVKSDPLKTGRFKDALNPFRAMTPAEKQVWSEIINESFERFIGVIDENRPQVKIVKEAAAVAQQDPSVVPHPQRLISTKKGVEEDKDLATGRIFTATQALKYGLIDEIGFQDEALDALQQQLDLADVRVVEYVHPQSLLEMALGLVQSQEANLQRQQMLDSSVPRAMYYFSWVPPTLPVPSVSTE